LSLESRYLLLINEVMGDVPLQDITQETIDRAVVKAFSGWQAGPNSKVRKYKNSTINRHFITPLASVLHNAAEWGWMPYMRIKKYPEKRPAPEWADKEWFDKFFQYADEDLAVLVKFLAYTGCRISEALNLEWRDISLREQRAYVRVTKNGEPREVYLPEALCNILQRGEGRVFKAFNNRYIVNSRLKSVAKKADIKYLSTHKVGSHTFATSLARYAGMDAKRLTMTGRWKDVKSTYHYTHYVQEQEAREAEKLGQLFDIDTKTDTD